MGLVGTVGFAVKCLDVLAWPLLALGYPLYASILAIETNSSADAQKLVTYWILFSLISLVEHALGALLVWLPFWPYTKLAFIAWLMIPHFGGAFYVYKHLVRPCFSITSPAVIDKLNKRKELSLKEEDFLVEAEKYLHQNGHEALEKLLSTQSMCKKPMVASTHIVTAEVKEKKEVVAVEEIQSRFSESTVVQKDNIVAESKGHNEVITTVVKKVDSAGPNLTESVLTFGSLDNKEILHAAKEHPTLPMAVSVQDLGQVPLLEGQKEWTCALCQVTTNGESVLKSHLQGKKHKAALEALKAEKRPLLFNDAKKPVFKALKAKTPQLHSKDVRKATLEALKANNPQLHSKEVRKATLEALKANNPQLHSKEVRKATLEARKAKKQQLLSKQMNKTDQSKQETHKCVTNNGIGQPAAQWCSICDVTCSGIDNFVQHCNGKKHMARIEELTSLKNG